MHSDTFLQLKLMSTVHQTQPTIQLLLANSEFVGALDLISTTQEVLAQELQGLVCFRSVYVCVYLEKDGKLLKLKLSVSFWG